MKIACITTMLHKKQLVSLLASCLVGAASLNAASVWLDQLDLARTSQGWGTPHMNQSVDGHPLTIAGKKFDRGLGTHAESVLNIDLKGDAQQFSASVGVDDEIAKPEATVEFSVIGDGKTLWKSGVMKKGQAAKPVQVNLDGVKTLMLLVGDAGDGINYDHADWVNAKIEYSGARPVTMNAPHEEAVILTPTAPATPRINGAKVFGVRPGPPFFFTIAATGERPMTFSVDKLAARAQVGPVHRPHHRRHARQGRIQRHAARGKPRGSGGAQVQASSAATDRANAAMGWNSWNCFAGAVTEESESRGRRHGGQRLDQSRLDLHQHRRFWQVIGSRSSLQGRARRRGDDFTEPAISRHESLADYVHAKA